MAAPLTYKDWLKETISAGGTGTLTLGAASSGYQAFAAGDDAKLFPYSIQDGTAWETGYGTYTHSGTTFARTTRIASSTGAALNVTTAALIWVDVVSTIAQGFDIAAQSIIPGGRLTLTTAVPAAAADVTGATTIYYTPYVHNGISLWDGNRWQPTIFAEVSLALGTLTSSKPYDVFGYLSSGALATELLAWTSTSARATTITLQDGRYCKNGDKTRLYLGTFYTTATTTTEDSAANRFVFNMYNRRLRPLARYVSGSHTYGTASFREWDGGTNARASFIVGLAEGFIKSTASCNSDVTSGILVVVCTWTNGAQFGTGFRRANVGGELGHSWSDAATVVLGLNYISVAEYASATTTFEEGMATADWLC